MDAYDRKTLTRIFQCFILFLALRLVEELLIIPRSINSRGLIACVVGMVILLIYIRFINKPLEKIGMIFSRHKIRKGIVLAVILNVVPAVIVYAFEYIRISATPGHTVICFFYDSVQHAYSSVGFLRFAMWLVIGMLINVIYAFFYEMAFRGLLITLGMRSLRFWRANWLQAGLYTLWFLIPVVRLMLYSSSSDSANQIPFLFFVILLYEMLTAVKLGLLRHATGSIWACIFDHFAFAYIMDVIHVQHTALNMTVQLDQYYYLRIICYQAVSLLVVFLYNFNQKRVRKHTKSHRASSR